MPIITVKIARGRSVEVKRELAKVLTESAVSVLDVKPEWVTVLIDEYDRSDWATGGELHSDRFGDGCGKQGTGEETQ